MQGLPPVFWRQVTDTACIVPALMQVLPGSICQHWRKWRVPGSRAITIGYESGDEHEPTSSTPGMHVERQHVDFEQGQPGV